MRRIALPESCEKWRSHANHHSKPGEAVYIGKDIAVTVLDVNGKQIRIGIDAPMDVPIERDNIKSRPVNWNRRGR